jgi:hypothetical protein
MFPLQSSCAASGARVRVFDCADRLDHQLDQVFQFDSLLPSSLSARMGSFLAGMPAAAG